MKFEFFFISFLLSCLQGCYSQSSTDDLFLNYSNKGHIPYVFKICNERIIVGDGRRITEFDKKGNKLSDMTLPKAFLNGKPFLDLFPVGERTYLATFYGDLYEITASSQSLICSKFGELLRGNSKVVFSTIQTSDDKGIKNTINVFDRDLRRTYSYPKHDLATSNLELVGDSLALISGENFVLIPLDTAFKAETISMAAYDNLYFVGKQDSAYVFVKRDYDAKSDDLFFFNERMNFSFKRTLDVSYEDISNLEKGDDTHYMEAPFGNFFYFDDQTVCIYVFRSLDNDRIQVMPILKHLK